MVATGLLSGYRVRVRDSRLNIVGEIDDYQRLDLDLLFNKVSRWVLSARPGTSAVDALRDPGAGIIVQRLHPGYADDGAVVLSGVWDTFKDIYNDQGSHVEVAGPDDMYVIDDELAYPDVTGSFSSNAYDVFGPAPTETVMYHYVSGNVGPTAIPARLAPGTRPAITLGTDLGRGTAITARARFPRLLDMLQAFALGGSPEMGFRVVQVGGALQFQVYQPVARSANVRFGPDLGNVLTFERTQSAPSGDHVIVAGGGVLTARTFYEQEDVLAITTWNRRRVVFRDMRASSTVAELQVGATEELARGAAQVGLSITPIDTPTQQYLVDYNLGDKVTVLTRGASAAVNATADLVRQVRIQLQGGQAHQVQPLIGGTSTPDRPDAAIISDLKKRLLALESVQ